MRSTQLNEVKPKNPDNNLIGINISYRQQSSKSNSERYQQQSQGSHLGAGQDIHITATGVQQVVFKNLCHQLKLTK